GNSGLESQRDSIVQPRVASPRATLGMRPNHDQPQRGCILPLFFSINFNFRKAFGLAAFGAFLFMAFCVHAQSTNALPPLAPAAPEIPPTFWERQTTTFERHGFAMMAGFAVVLVAIVWGLWLALRTKPQLELPAETVARRALEKLRGKPEDGPLLSEVSQSLRHYVASVLQLPAGELATAELVAALAHQTRFDRDLAGEISSFLQECDRRKFSPTANPEPLGAVSRALELAEKIQRDRRAS
ncbi:MAG TPA: hypothetical protein VF988_12815, partial [Verrucomicrobiae bacterium]